MEQIFTFKVTLCYYRCNKYCKFVNIFSFCLMYRTGHFQKGGFSKKIANLLKIIPANINMNIQLRK